MEVDQWRILDWMIIVPPQQNKFVFQEISSVPKEFNGYEAGTSVVQKSVVEAFGREGKWSWEKTVYPAMSKDIHVHIDNTKFWDMGTPERLERLEEFFNESRS